MEEFTVSTYSEYAAVIEQIYGDYTTADTLIVFRGQTAEYRLPDGRLSIVPSGFRTARPHAVEGLLPALLRYFEAYLRMDELAKELLETNFKNSFKDFISHYLPPSVGGDLCDASELTDLPSVFWALHSDRFMAAVAQHYGAPTGMLDVTTDSDVALWFAVHRYCHGGRGRPVRYESSGDPGYVYVLLAAADQVVPLSAFFFDWSTRPRRQQAAALFRLYETLPDELRERALRAMPRWAVPERPAGNSFADWVIARICVGDAVSAPVAGWTTAHLFPCPDEDALYAHLLKNCSWAEKFVHCRTSPKPSASTIATATLRTRPVVSNRALASDPSWFTILLLGDDAHAAHQYAWRTLYLGSPLGVVSLFDKQGLNLIVVTGDEAKELILESGVTAILFCDVGGALTQDGIAEDVCQRIAQSGKVVVPAYTNLDKRWRRFSEEPFHMMDWESEGRKISTQLRSAIETSWQLQRAAPSSLCRRQFSDQSRVMFRGP